MVNRDKVNDWKADVARSVDFYNQWFLDFAPRAFKETRVETAKQVKQALAWTRNLTDISPSILQQHPDILPMLRMTTCPPIARDRLVGLAGVKKSLVNTMEIENRVPPQMHPMMLTQQLDKIGDILERLADSDIFVWKDRGDYGTAQEVYRASIIIADRLCGAMTNPIIRNAQEQRQLKAIKDWLEARGYRALVPGEADIFTDMPSGTFSFRFNVEGLSDNGARTVRIPVDAVIMPLNAAYGDYPLLFEAKSAGDFTNVNKRRKEEGKKIQQLRKAHGDQITFDLFLCGYFNTSFLGYVAAEGIDWVWEHRVDDLSQFGL